MLMRTFSSRSQQRFSLGASAGVETVADVVMGTASPNFWRASAPTWWLDMTKPSGETKEPEPPLLKRTEESAKVVEP